MYQHQLDGGGLGGSSSSSSAALAVGKICSTPNLVSVKSRKPPSQPISSGQSCFVGVGAKTSAAVVYKSPQLQRQLSGGFTVHGYTSGMNSGVRSSSRESGSSSSRTTSRTGSRGGMLPSISSLPVTNKRGRNSSRNKPDPLMDRETALSLDSPMFKGKISLNIYKEQTNDFT